MSPDEVFVTVASIVVGPAAWLFWLYRQHEIGALRQTRGTVNLLRAIVVLCGVLVFVVLRWAASPDVRDAPQYLFMYLMLGFAWLRLAELLFAYLGISTRDDVVERRNGAAVSAIAGALVGVTFCYAGGNIGSGPGWWVVVGCAIIATSALGLAWLALNAISHVNDLVTIDRDRATGIRLGAVLAASGLILGRAVAGDWLMLGVTLADFGRLAWVVVPLVLVAAAIDRVARPTVVQPQPSVALAGVVPALLYFIVAIGYVVALGPPA